MSWFWIVVIVGASLVVVSFIVGNWKIVSGWFRRIKAIADANRTARAAAKVSPAERLGPEATIEEQMLALTKGGALAIDTEGFGQGKNVIVKDAQRYVGLYRDLRPRPGEEHPVLLLNDGTRLMRRTIEPVSGWYRFSDTLTLRDGEARTSFEASCIAFGQKGSATAEWRGKVLAILDVGYFQTPDGPARYAWCESRAGLTYVLLDRKGPGDIVLVGSLVDVNKLVLGVYPAPR